jgi:O-antigen ligase
MSGHGGNANMFAFNLVMAFPLVLALMLSKGSFLGRGFYSGVVFIAVSGIMVSLSRSAYLSMAMMVTFWLVRFRRPQYAIPMLIGGAVALMLAPESFFARLSTLSAEGPSDASAQKRLEMLGPVLDAFLTNPLVGIGLMRFVPFTYEHGYDVHGVIHNAFLQVGAEQGLLGLIPFLAITMLAWRDYGRSWRTAQRMRMHKDPELRGLALRSLLFQMSMVGVLTMSMFQPTMRHKGLWILFAVSAVMLKLVRRRTQTLAAQAVPQPPGPEAPLGSHATEPVRA